MKGNQYKLDDKVISQLPEEFREQSTKHRHLGAYVSALPIDEIGIPEYKSFISRSVDTQEKRNLVYPVGGGVFIHVGHDPEDTRDYYLAVEPSLAPELEGITSDVDSQLME